MKLTLFSSFILHPYVHKFVLTMRIHVKPNKHLEIDILSNLPEKSISFLEKFSGSTTTSSPNSVHSIEDAKINKNR